MMLDKFSLPSKCTRMKKISNYINQYKTLPNHIAFLDELKNNAKPHLIRVHHSQYLGD